MDTPRKPTIRFKGFEEEWEEKKFGDIVTTRRGLTYKPSDIREDGIRVLRSSNISEDSFVLSDDDVFVTREAVNIDFASENDILITSANGSSRLVGKHAIVSGLSEKPAVHGGFMLLGTTKEPYFVNASMGSSWYKRFVELFVAGGNGAIGNLSKSDLDNQEMLVPSQMEQGAIGAFFARLDALIALHQRKYEKLQVVKKAMLEKMFPQNGSTVPEIRFHGFADDWKQKKLGEVCEITSGFMGDSLLTNGLYKLTRIETIADGTVDELRVGYSNVKPDDGYLLRTGDILYSNINSISHMGKVAQFHGGLLFIMALIFSDYLQIRQRTLIFYCNF